MLLQGDDSWQPSSLPGVTGHYKEEKAIVLAFKELTTW